MVQLLDPTFWIEEEAPPLRGIEAATVAAAMSFTALERPRTFRQPPPPPFLRGRLSVPKLMRHAHRAHQQHNSPELGKIYGQLVVEFQPAIRWIISCWEFLLSTEGCRFLPRTADEKRYCHGDYRVLLEKDFTSFAHRVFKQQFLGTLDAQGSKSFHSHLYRNLWPAVRKAYCALENPPDPNQRKLTGYSYLRCVPYRFFNSAHQKRVNRTIRKLPGDERQVLELYTLRFYREEAVLGAVNLSPETFRRLRTRALRNIVKQDRLSCALLLQIERY